jgi:P-type conjugative transfer protein TrbL
MSRAVVLAATLLLVPSLASAQVTPTQVGGILTGFQAVTQGWNNTLIPIAEELFFGLALISFVLTTGFGLLQGGSPMDLLAALLRQIILLGFWSFILEGWPTFGHAIIASFQDAAQQAGAMPMSPADVVSAGSDIGNRIMNMAPWYDVPSKMLLIFPASFAAVGYYLAAAQMLLTLAKAIMVISLGTLLLGFAGCHFTDYIARHVIGATVAIGARLFAVQMLTALGATIIQTVIGNATAISGLGMWTIIGMSVVYAIIMWGIPAMVENMAGGGGHGHVGPGMLVRAIGTTLSVASGVGGVAMAGYSAIAAADSKSPGLLPGSGGTASLPPSGEAGGAGGAAPAGARMHPPGFTVKA